MDKNKNDDMPIAPERKPDVVNLSPPNSSWSPEQVARELTQLIDAGGIKSVVVAIEYDEDYIEEHDQVFDWLGSKQTYNERVYLVTWFYQRFMRRIFF